VREDKSKILIKTAVFLKDRAVKSKPYSISLGDGRGEGFDIFDF
jgi:hypothetical protein